MTVPRARLALIAGPVGLVPTVVPHGVPEWVAVFKSRGRAISEGPACRQ